MPNFKTRVNTKKVAAKQRKDTLEEEKRLIKEGALETKLALEWSVGSRDTSKQETALLKKQEKLLKKKERDEAEARESAELAKYKPARLHAHTTSSLQEGILKRSQAAKTPASELELEGKVSLLDISKQALPESNIDKHPEKRMKAAYFAFEERHLPGLKEENPTLRLSQLRQMLNKIWQRSPENPLNWKITSNGSDE